MGALFQTSKRPEPIRLIRQRLPKHVAIAIDTQGSASGSLGLDTLKSLIEVQVKLGIHGMTFNVLPSSSALEPHALIEMLTGLHEWTFLDAYKVKVSVLGRWYDLPELVVDRIKAVIIRTKDYSRFIVNIGVNYDGQEELVDAISRIARQVRSQKVDPERITKDTVKSNLDTALLAPPNLIITTGKTFSLRSFMLWDAAHAKIFFSNVPWSQFNRSHLLKALVFYQNTGDEEGQGRKKVLA